MDAMTIEQRVEALLQPTDAAANWYRAVAALDRAAATPIVMAVLEDETATAHRRRLAATMLGVLGDARAIPALARALGAPDRVLRGRAAETLGAFPQLDAEIVRQLVIGLTDPDPYFRECAAKALGQLKRTDALPMLHAMRETDPLASNRDVARDAIDAIRTGR
jgi:HEAT repeat protein